MALTTVLFVVALVVGLPLLAFGLHVLVKSDSRADTRLTIGTHEFSSGSVGITAIFFALAWMLALILLGLNVRPEATLGGRNTIPDAPQAQPTAVVTVPVSSTPEPTPSAPTSSTAAPLSESPSSRPGGSTPSSSVGTTTTKPAPKPKGPWSSEENDVRVVVESCSHLHSRRGLFGCAIRIENRSSEDMTFVNESAVLFVDNRENSYGLDDSGTTFDASRYSTIESQETRRGRAVLEKNPPPAASTLQLRVTMSGYKITTFTISVNLPYD